MSYFSGEHFFRHYECMDILFALRTLRSRRPRIRKLRNVPLIAARRGREWCKCDREHLAETRQPPHPSMSSNTASSFSIQSWDTDICQRNKVMIIRYWNLAWKTKRSLSRPTYWGCPKKKQSTLRLPYIIAACELLLSVQLYNNFHEFSIKNILTPCFRPLCFSLPETILRYI